MQVPGLIIVDSLIRIVKEENNEELKYFIQKKFNMRFTRKLHRYLGLLIGIQFIFWTLGGAFFAWSDIDQIRGDFNKKPTPAFSGFKNWKSPEVVFTQLQLKKEPDSIQSLKAIEILGEPVYQVAYYKNSVLQYALFYAVSGKYRKSLNEQEAVELAMSRFTPASEIEKIELLTSENVNRHHEYRNQSLPAYAVSFKHPSGTVVYISAEMGEVLKFRNNNWRIFDFFWMMHTMDYRSRDNFGNVLLRVFSILGLITILSGFWLFIQSWKYGVKRKK